MRRHYRKNARFVDDHAHCRPLDRNQRARILHLAEALERRTRPAGRRNGVVSQIGLRLLRALVLQFTRKGDGLCTPSYTTLQAATGLCRQSIARALQRLEACGLLKITRRLIRETVNSDGFPVTLCRQGSNLYSVHEPAPDADRIPTPAASARPFPRPALAGLARMLGWSKLETTGRAAMHQNIQNLQCFRA